MKKAFTLSEVLITLGILGVVAAITLPTLIQKQRDKETVSKLEKTYSILSQAVTLAQNEHGEISTWNIKDANLASTREIFSYFEPYIKIIRKCDNKAGCWNNETKALSGAVAPWSANLKQGVDYINFTLTDGVNVAYDHFATNYAIFGLPTDLNSHFGMFYVDTNGDKAPNTVGRDIFIFALYKNRLIPLGIADNASTCNPKNRNTYAGGDFTGYGCAYKVLQEKAINY